MRTYRWLLVFFLSLAILGCAKARTYSLYLRYQPVQEFSSLKQKIGSTLGMVPFKDERPEQLYVGILTPFQGVSSYFKSEPFPLEKAMRESLTEVLSRQGVKTVPVSNWDGEPGSLKNIETDSVFTIEIKKFWIEGKENVPFKANVKTSTHFVILLGLKKEGKVFTRNVTVEKEMTVFRLAPDKAEQIVNGILTEVFDTFFSDPY
jgi:hypothetical protein